MCSSITIHNEKRALFTQTHWSDTSQIVQNTILKPINGHEKTIFLEYSMTLNLDQCAAAYLHLHLTDSKFWRIEVNVGKGAKKQLFLKGQRVNDDDNFLHSTLCCFLPIFFLSLDGIPVTQEDHRQDTKLPLLFLGSWLRWAGPASRRWFNDKNCASWDWQEQQRNWY